MTYKITHNGKQYEIGKIYRSSEGYIGALDGMDGPRFIIGNGIDLRTCLAIEEIDKSAVGTIKDAPRQDGWYMCKWEEQTGSETFSHPRQPFESKGGVLIGAPEDKAFFEVLYKMERAK